MLATHYVHCLEQQDLQETLTQQGKHSYLTSMLIFRVKPLVDQCFVTVFSLIGEIHRKLLR